MNWKLILQQSWKKTLLVGGLLFIIGCAISFFLFANKMAVLIGLPFWFYEKGIIPSLGDLEDHTIFLTISLLADIFFWLLVAFFVVINKKFRWVVILILLVITVFTIWSFYGKSQSVQTGAPPSPVELCETDNDCINVITGDTEGYKAQACVNKNYKNYNLQPYDYPGKILSETGEDKCECLQWGAEKKMYKTCGFKQKIDTSNWKTYRNEKYGLEFKYPNDLRVDDFTSVGIPKTDVLLYLIKGDKNNPPDIRFLIMENYYNENDTLGIGDLFYRFFNVRLDNKIELLNEEIDGHHVLSARFSIASGKNSEIKEYKGIIMNNGADSVGIQSNFPMEDSKLLDQILSTFKFTK